MRSAAEPVAATRSEIQRRERNGIDRDTSGDRSGSRTGSDLDRGPPGAGCRPQLGDHPRPPVRRDGPRAARESPRRARRSSGDSVSVLYPLPSRGGETRGGDRHGTLRGSRPSLARCDTSRRLSTGRKSTTRSSSTRRLPSSSTSETSKPQHRATIETDCCHWVPAQYIAGPPVPTDRVRMLTGRVFSADAPHPVSFGRQRSIRPSAPPARPRRSSRVGRLESRASSPRYWHRARS